jgi:orotidine 5'-phosphate decarboxylase subfamily 1
MEKKESNLVVAADVTTKFELLDLAEKVGPEICFLKTHMDIINDFDWDLIIQLKMIAEKYNFLIVEDRKFGDIGSTVQAQYKNGIYKFIQWADLIIVHAICGAESIKALEAAADDYGSDLRGVLLIAQLSCKENLIDSTYTNHVVDMAKNNTFIVGLIAQKDFGNPALLTFTPGISMNQSSDAFGQQYNSPEFAIQVQGADLIIVGRSIYKAVDPRKAAQEYRKIAWKAYQNRLECTLPHDCR